MNTWISFYLGYGYYVYCLVSQETCSRLDEGEFDFVVGAIKWYAIDDEEFYRLGIPKHLLLDRRESFCQGTFDKEENDSYLEWYEQYSKEELI